MGIIKYIAKNILKSIEKERIRKEELAEANIYRIDIAYKCFDENVIMIQTDKNYLLNFIRKNLNYQMRGFALKTLKVKDCLLIWVESKLSFKDILEFVCNKILNNEINYYKYNLNQTED